MNLRLTLDSRAGRLVLILIDCIGILFSYVFVSQAFRSVPQAMGFEFLPMKLETMVAITLLSLLIFGLGGMYSSLWEYSGSREMIQVSLVTLLATGAGLFISILVNNRMRYSMYVFVWIIMLLICGGVRILMHLLPRRRFRFARRRGRPGQPRVMIIGAGFMGSLIISRMQDETLNLGQAVVCIDDDPNKWGKRIHGVRVEGGREEIQRVARDARIDEIIVAITSLDAASRQEVYKLAMATGCRLKTAQDFHDIFLDSDAPLVLREVRVEDLLARKEIKLDNEAIADYIRGQTVLVTGGGGSIGSELCRQLVLFGPHRLVLYDIYENNVFDLRNELRESVPPELDLVIAIGSVRDTARLDAVFARYRPQVVFHAAAHKHVPLMEDSPGEAIKNNVFGTLNVAETAERYGANRFVMISTDKAVNPTNVMGATKRLAESIVQGLFRDSETLFAVVRFGNVLGSNGSVIPTFRHQIARGGPLTVTHPDIVRFFMTIPEAARLVLQAASMTRGGEIYILNMGEPVRILDLAENLIRLSGYEPYREIDIAFTGLRPGEKLYEELQMSDEETLTTENRDIMVCASVQLGTDEIRRQLAQLEEVVDSTPSEVKRLIQRLVPSYQPQIKAWDEEEDPDRAFALESAARLDPSHDDHRREQDGYGAPAPADWRRKRQTLANGKVSPRP